MLAALGLIAGVALVLISGGLLIVVSRSGPASAPTNVAPDLVEVPPEEGGWEDHQRYRAALERKRARGAPTHD